MIQTRPRRATPPVPPRWCAMCQALWGFDASQGVLFWHALLGSRRTVPCQFKYQCLILKTTTVDALLDYAQRVWKPAVVVEVIEALYQEHRLTRAHATALEERIFARTTAEGLWR